MRNEKQWVLVLNATNARILRNLVRGGATSGDEIVLRAESRSLKDIMSDKPGRSFSSGSAGRRSGMEYGSDPVHEDALAFARKVVEELETLRIAHAFDQLAIFADPEMLGIIRKQLPKALKAMVNAEVDKNLLHESEHDLPRIVAESLYS
jgi:protein required for attachment to host cells